MAERRSKLTPLLVRSGARYACAGDGLCCSSVHAVGPLSRSERRMLTAIDPRLVVHRKESRDHVLIHGEDQRCPFVRADGCMIHNQFGPEAKPIACIRFPLRLTATPHGGRVSLSHLCPCASVGERPELTGEMAEPSLRDARGKLEAEHRVVDGIPLTPRKRVDFDTYLAWETPLLSRLASARDPLAALDTAPLSRPRKGSYRKLAEALYETEENNRYDSACRFLGCALLQELQQDTKGKRIPWPERPWQSDFERTAKRCAKGESAARVFGDWLANDIWALLWTPRTSAQGLLRELASLTLLGQRIAGGLKARGIAAAPAAAEALTILELGRDASEWKALHRAS